MSTVSATDSPSTKCGVGLQTSRLARPVGFGRCECDLSCRTISPRLQREMKMPISPKPRQELSTRQWPMTHWLALHQRLRERFLHRPRSVIPPHPFAALDLSSCLSFQMPLPSSISPSRMIITSGGFSTHHSFMGTYFPHGVNTGS
jgi:hypothetical protein